MHYKKRYTEKSARSKKNTKILIEQNEISNNVKENDVKENDVKENDVIDNDVIDNNVIDNNDEKASLIFNSELGDNENLQETQKACIERTAVNSAIVDKDLEFDMDIDIEPIDIEPLNIDIEFLDIDIKPVVMNTEPIKTNTEQSLGKDKLQDDSVIKTETEAETVLNNLQTLINSNNRGSNVNVLIEGIPGIISGEVIFENVAVVVLKHENISVYINPEKIVAFY